MPRVRRIPSASPSKGDGPSITAPVHVVGLVWTGLVRRRVISGDTALSQAAFEIENWVGLDKSGLSRHQREAGYCAQADIAIERVYTQR